MFSLTFQTLSGETVMLPVMQTSFIERKSGEVVWVDAWCNGQMFSLNATMSEIIRMSNGMIQHKDLGTFR